MTKEELEKEIKNYIDKNCEQWETDGLTVDDIVRIAVLDFAEPREKRIAELEKENAELKEHLKCLIVGMYHIAQHHPTMGAHTKIMQDLREAEQFISEVEK